MRHRSSKRLGVNLRLSASPWRFEALQQIKACNKTSNRRASNRLQMVPDYPFLPKRPSALQPDTEHPEIQKHWLTARKTDLAN
jgi:hypothetical protein